MSALKPSMSHTTTAVVGRRCELARASWKVAWWPRPVSGSVSARSRSEPMSSAVCRQAAPWVASCSSSSTSSVPTTAGSSEASTRAPSSSPWANSADGDQRLDARGAQLGQVGRGRRVLLADGEERDPVLDPRPDRLERRGAQDALPAGRTRPTAAGRRRRRSCARAAPSPAGRGRARRSAARQRPQWRPAGRRSRRRGAAGAACPTRSADRPARRCAHRGRGRTRAGSRGRRRAAAARDSMLSTPTVRPPARNGKHASATTAGLASR